jgi:hypothetical protein
MAELPTRRTGDAARASARARVGAATRRRDQLASLREEKFKRIAAGRGLHSFPFQLNLSSSVQRITRLSS